MDHVSADQPDYLIPVGLFTAYISFLRKGRAALEVGRQFQSTSDLRL
jgi:hypothetical protein